MYLTKSWTVYFIPVHNKTGFMIFYTHILYGMTFNIILFKYCDSNAKPYILQMTVHQDILANYITKNKTSFKLTLTHLISRLDSRKLGVIEQVYNLQCVLIFNHEQ